MKNYKYIFFDFDGTLVNSMEGTRKSAEYALKKIIEDNEDLGKLFCGPTLKQSFESFALNNEQINRAIELYRIYQAENTIEINTLYDGIKILLKNLKKNNKILILVTVKYEKTAIKILKHLGIFKYFDYIFGTTGNSQDKVFLLKKACESIDSLNLSECIMIGDRISDIHAGKLNNMDTMGVLYGMENREDLIKSESTYLIETPYEILDILFNKNNSIK